jgi:hypothetical protein
MATFGWQGRITGIAILCSKLLTNLFFNSKLVFVWFRLIARRSVGKSGWKSTGFGEASG